MSATIHAIGVFEGHIEEVRRTIPSRRLLVYRVTDGWEPVCAFLGRAVPDAAFPDVNSTDEFRRRSLAAGEPRTADRSGWSGSPPPTRRRSRVVRRRSNENIHSTTQMSCVSRARLDTLRSF